MWKQNKYFYLACYVMVLILFVSMCLRGYYFLLLPVVIFVVLPIIDFFIRDEPPTEHALERMETDQFYRNVLLCYLPVQVVLIIGGMVYVASIHLSNIELGMMIVSVGIITGGVGINIAHELMHKANRWCQLNSRALLAMVCYGHFFVEHVRGHHVRVATAKDPATARLNEPFYYFFPRTVLGSWLSAWRLEKKSLKNQNIPVYHWSNEFYWIVSVPGALCLLSFFLAGWLGVIFFLGQSFVAILMLEIVNYIEHYGLVRNQLSPGTYEPVSPRASWDANHWLSNRILFNLMRHADHHANGAKPYQSLTYEKDSPKLPASYTGLYWLVLIPPLWFSVMNPRVQALQDNDCLMEY